MKEHKVLIVDDSSSTIQLFITALQDECQIQIAKKGYEAIAKAIDWNPDIILLDIMLPDISGYDVCKILKDNRNTAKIPVIFMTGLSDESDEAKGLAIGAADYITKPFSISLAKARIMNNLAFKHQRDNLEHLVEEQTRLIELTQTNTIETMGSLAEFRSYETGSHINRCKKYIGLIANKLRGHPKFNKYLDTKTIELLLKIAPLHDIGKITIPERILFKPDKLTSVEFNIIKTHTIAGENILLSIAGKELKNSYYFILARQIAVSHHEMWNGMGYPYGLSGENIPLPGRIMSIVDVYDALTSKRIYKPALNHDKSLEIMAKNRGIAFDPEIFDVFLVLEDEFRKESETNNTEDNNISTQELY